MLPKEFVNYQDKLYSVFKKVKQSSIKEGYLNDVKDFWNCDIVVKSRTNDQDTLLFLKEIEEAIIVKKII
jgi:hypothetical protein